MGRYVVGWISALRLAPHLGGDTLLQFSENSATGEGEDTYNREKQIADAKREGAIERA